MKLKQAVCMLMIAASVVLLAAGPSVAAGPDDGIWFVVQSNPTHGAFQYYTSVHQNGVTVVLMSAYGNGRWDFGIGTRSGNTVEGTAYDAVTGAAYGTFSVTLTSSTTFNGHVVIDGVVWSLSGSKLF
jgi:hypothetical protein